MRILYEVSLKIDEKGGRMLEKDISRYLRVLMAYLLIGCFLTGNVISAYASSETLTDLDYLSGNETENSDYIETDPSEDIGAETRQDQSTSQESLTESNSLAESDHPYANNFEYTWTISEPGAAQIRLHFDYLKLGEPGKLSSNFQVYDKLILYDKYDNVLKTYGRSSGVNLQDFWTEWYAVDTLKVKLVTDSSGTANGFIIDKTETRMDMSTSKGSLDESNSLTESNPVAESDHPYANNYKNSWTINEPGAAQIRLHFDYLKLGEPGKLSSNFQVYDKLILYDKYDNVLKTYGRSSGVNLQDFWTEWYAVDTLKVKLVTDSSGTANGFIIDKTDIRTDTITFPPGEGETPTEVPSTVETTTKPPKEEPSVQLHGEKTKVVEGDDILLKLSAVNLITKPTMHIQVIILPPSGMSVSSSEFVQSGAGQYTTTYELEPGDGKDIEVRIAANQVGDFNVKGRAIYYFGDDIENAESYTLSLPIQVTEKTPSSSNSETGDVEKSPGFGSFTAVFGLLAFYTLKKRIF